MALKPLNSVGGFSVGETPSNVIYPNGDFSGNKANFTGNIAALGLLTDNLYYANGIPWDLQDAAGLNGYVQFNNNNNFAASANFIFDSSNNVLTVTGNANVTNTLSAGNVRTNNLLYANGTPWDFQEAAGANTQIQYNMGNNFAASANFTYNDTTQQFTVLGNGQFNNANLGNVAIANFVNVASNVTSSNLTVNLELQANTANFDGNVVMDNWLTVANTANVGNLRTDNLLYANGQPWDLQEAAGSNNQIQFNSNNNFSASANFTFDPATNNLALNGNMLYGQSGQNQIVNLSNTALEIRGGWNANNSTAVNIAVGDYANSTNWGKLSILGNLSGNSVGFAEANAFIFTNPGYSSGNVVKVDILNPAATSTTTGVIQANGGIGVSGNGYFGGNLSVTGDIANANNISVTNALNAVTGNFSGNINSLNANLGNLATANYVNVSQQINGNVANFSGNLYSLNADLGNLALANYINVANDLNVFGNIYGPNFVGDLANGNSNVKVYSNANVEISVNGTSNVATFTDTEFRVVGEIKSTSGNILSNGSVTANGFLNGANANVTGEGLFGSVKTANIVAPTGNITISAAGTNESIYLVPTGTGTIDTGRFRVAQVGDPTQPYDAATKEYVDNIAQGLSVHSPVRVTSTTNLNATYADGGTALTTTTISGGKTITFSANHGLSVGDEIYWTNSFNGIIANDAYFVYSTPALNQITVKAGFFGAEVTTLTNGTGLTQAARGNPGVGATLTNAGANVALSIDSVSLALNNRVLVQGQTNQFENGVYTVTTVGNGSTAWVLTRATDEDQYDPKSTTGLAYGDYFFVQQGTNAAGSSYVLTTPTGEIVFGVTNIGFSQFSASGSYTAGNGIAINGTIISANTDGVTTDIVGGNIVVKASAQLTTPNIGAATGTSLNVTGNVDANGLSITNLANIGGNLTVDGYIFSNNAVSSNANVSGTNLNASGNVEAGGNVIAGNITANSTVFASNANVSGTTITSALTVNNAISGNTANFSGNIVVNNATVNLELAGNTANFSGNVVFNGTSVTVGNALLGNTANFSGNVVVPNLAVNLELAGNTANFTGNISAANANLGNLATANFFTGTLVNGTSNAYINGSGGNFLISVGGNANVVEVSASGVGIAGNLNVGNLTANTLVANNSVEIGNTDIGWGTVTTSSITANQTIAQFAVAGVTGVEFLVKGIDSSGSKYSVATVTAVTDGATNTDYAVYATATIGGATGTLVVNKTGSNLALQVTPASSNSTVWTAQYRTI